MNDESQSAGDELHQMSDDLEWHEPEDRTPREQCPCCDYVTLPERNNYLICPICFWEEDGIDVDRLDIPSGPNHMTLREGRANFQRIGACDQKMLENVMRVADRIAFEYRPRHVQ